MIAPENNTSLSAVLALDIQERRNKDLDAKINAYPRAVPILSDIGECDRQICYSVTNWKDRPLHDSELQARFDAGNLWERELNAMLNNLGYNVSRQQMPVDIKARDGTTIARGKIDGIITYHSTKIPYEIKTTHPNIYARIETYDDFQKKPWLRKYTRQIQMYLYGNNCEEGLFIITDCLGHIKTIPVYLDYGECELILKRLEAVHEHLKAGTLAPRIEYRDDVCGKCPFAKTCLQDIMRTEAEILTSDVLLGKLEQREKLKAAAKEYEELDGEVKKELQGIKKGVAGEFVIIGKEVNRKGYTVEDKAYWQVGIKKL